MPQMSPLSWWLLLMYFLLLLILFSIMNYYIFLYSSPNKLLTSFKKTSLNWKW
uniref:ATP synthase complex subunit 8 n=1 Tax=Psychopsis coelivaga TaxID=1821760 RepID=A0A1S5QYH2_9NEOP|nr:ATP synthase F0 subunit 8 [Psychopsis coelivaga]